MNPPNFPVYSYNSPTSSSPSSQEDDDFLNSLARLSPLHYWFDLAGEEVDSIQGDWLQLTEAENFTQFETLLDNAAQWYLDKTVEIVAAKVTELIHFVIINPAILKTVFEHVQADLKNITEIQQMGIFANLLLETAEFNTIHFFYWHNLTKTADDELFASLPQFLNINPYADLFSDLLFALHKISKLSELKNANTVAKVIEYVVLKNPDILNSIFNRHDKTNPFDGKNPILIFKSIVLRMNIEHASEKSCAYQPCYGLTNDFILLDNWCKKQNEPTWVFMNGWKNLQTHKNFNDFEELLFELFILKSEHPVPSSKVIQLIRMIFEDTDTLSYYYDTYKLMDGSDYLCSNTLGVFQGLMNEFESWADPENIHITWHKKAGLSTENLDAKWKELVDIRDFDEFASLLNRLRDKALKNLVNAKNVTLLIQTVIESATFAEFIFSRAQTAGANCAERPLSLFNEMLGFVYFRAKEKSDVEPKALLELAKGFVRQDLLAYAASMVYKQQWEEKRSYGYTSDPSFNDSEPLEYHVALCQQLKQKLQLPISVNSLFALGVAKLTEKDEELAIHFVNSAMDEGDLAEKLLAQPVWHGYIKQLSQSAIEPIEKEFGDRLDALELEQRAAMLEKKQQEEALMQAQFEKSLQEGGMEHAIAQQRLEVIKRPQKVVDKDYYIDPTYDAKSKHIMAEKERAIEELLKEETRKAIREW